MALIGRIEEAQTKLEQDHKVLEGKYNALLAKKLELEGKLVDEKKK